MSTPYAQELARIDFWDEYLLSHSNLPGPRGNLELLSVVARHGKRDDFHRWASLSASTAPENTPACFLACCGVVGLGTLIASGETSNFQQLHSLAQDPRWRIREAVAMALQILGETDMSLLLAEIHNWLTSSSPLVLRAAAAALCEPSLLRQPQDASQVLHILDSITAKMLSMPNRKTEDFRILRQAMAYCWSVAIAALPEIGKPLFEAWCIHPDPDLRWFLRQNLKKNRLLRMDPDWVHHALSSLS